jgi:ABC-2 type transport system permease protein
LIQAPNSPLAIGLTLFPLTGPIFALLRMALVEVPVWQLALSMAILIMSLLIGIWFVTRIFRAAMLMYGKSFRPKQILLALREA